MRADWRIEPLAAAHDRTRFDYGEPALDEHLARYARQNQDAGLARCFVATTHAEPQRILGYYALAAGAVERANLPAAQAKRFPRFPLPVARLARLAVDRSAQRGGLGEYLLLDALHRCADASRQLGLIGVVLDAKHERAKRFYQRYEFEPLPDQPLTLWLPMAAVHRLFGKS